MLTPRRRADRGISTLEVLVAVVLITMVVVFTWRIIGSTLAMLGSGNRGFQKSARVRTQATEWIHAVNEYTRRPGGFGVTAVGTYWIPTSPGPYSQGPLLPPGFSCGRVIIANWAGIPGPADPTTLRLVTVEIYRTVSTCGPGGPGTSPFIFAETAIAAR